MHFYSVVYEDLGFNLWLCHGFSAAIWVLAMQIEYKLGSRSSSMLVFYSVDAGMTNKSIYNRAHQTLYMSGRIV